MDQIWLWVGFNVFVLAMLALDLFVFHKEAHEVTPAEAAAWSVVWVALALIFDAGVYAFMGRAAGPGVPRRLPDREGALGRQHLRLRADLQLLSRAAALPAPRAVLGHPRRAGDARRHDRRGRLLIQQLPLDHLRVRRLPGLHRDPHGDCRTSTTSSRNRTPSSAWCAGSSRSPTIYHGQQFFVRQNRSAAARGWWRRRCSWCWCWSRRPTCSSRSTRSPRSSPSRRIRSSSSPRTSSRSSGCARCTSCSPT